MKTEELIALALAGVAVLLIVKTASAKGAAPFVSTWQAAKEILNGGKRYDNGWRYFDDGTTIDPQGNYYQGGQIIWSPIK